MQKLSADRNELNIMRLFLKIFAVFVLLLIILGGVGSFLYWRHLTSTPQYSLALIIDASRNNDQARLEKLIDTDKIVDSFMPQILEQAAELYGRGLPENLVKRVSFFLTPIMPSVKEKTRELLPGFISKETEQFRHIPFAAMVLGSGRYLDISISGDKAFVKSKLEKHSFEVEMIRNGDYWQISSVQDDKLARQIAEAFGQQFLKLAAEGDVRKAGESLGIEDLKNIIEDIEGIFK